jgi:hypothetical protein
MTSPKQAVATVHGRFYSDPNPAFDGALYPSVTNVLSSIAKPALVPAAAKEVAEHAMATLPALIKASRDPEAAKVALKELKSRAEVVWGMAADRGTQVHALAEAHMNGLPLPEMTPEIHAYFKQYLRFCTDYDVDIDTDVVASEASVVNRTVGYAGTMDFLINLRTALGDGKPLSLVDVKTSAKSSRFALYQEHPLQLAALKHAETIWLPNGMEEPMPLAEQCFILNLRPNGYALMPVEAGKQEFAAFKAFLAGTRYLHSQKLPKTEVLPVRSEKAVA